MGAGADEQEEEQDQDEHPGPGRGRPTFRAPSCAHHDQSCWAAGNRRGKWLCKLQNRYLPPTGRVGVCMRTNGPHSPIFGGAGGERGRILWHYRTCLAATSRRYVRDLPGRRSERGQAKLFATGARQAH